MSNNLTIETTDTESIGGNSMIGYYILDDKEPVEVPDIIVWATWFETADRIVEQTTVGRVTVSTVFLGLDYQFGDGPPLLFETMIFGSKHNDGQWRYSTWAEAVAGHTAALNSLHPMRHLFQWLRHVKWLCHIIPGVTHILKQRVETEVR